MKKQTLALAAGLLFSLAAAGLCNAQQATLVGSIPFDFQVGNKTLPAGEYSIQRSPIGSGCVELIRRSDLSATIAVLTMPVDPRDGKSKPVLLFNRYGNSHFLYQIWTGEGLGRQLSKSKREKELARSEVKTETEVALLTQSILERP